MTDKIISDLESAVTVTGDMLLPVENGEGTFAASVDDLKNYTEDKLGETASTVTAAGTTTLTSSSSPIQIFTGTTTQTAVFPNATTLRLNKAYRFINNSSGTITVNFNGGSLAFTLAGGTEAIAKVTNISTSAGVWLIYGKSSAAGKNAIINGDFNVWQRGTSFSAIADSTYNADRWRYIKTGAMVHTVSRSTDVPSVAQAGRMFNYSLLVDCTTIDGSIAATDFCAIEQRIEGYNWLPLAQRDLTLSFWVKATKTGIYSIYAKNSGGDKGYVGEYTINTTNTWEYKTVSISASPSAGTWDYTTGVGIMVGFSLACGSSLSNTAGTWGNGGYVGSPNQVNACDNTANNFQICGVQLEVGNKATDFEIRQIQKELALCHRYYWTEILYVAATISSIAVTGTRYPVPMRAAPTIAGGGTGFSEVVKSATGLSYAQTTTGQQTLTFNSEL